MAFQDPASGYFSPSGLPESSRGTDKIRLEPIPSVANIGPAPSLKSVSTQNYEPDKTWETIFKGMAKLGETAIGAIDQVIKLDLDDQLRTGVRNLQGQHLVDASEVKQEILDTYQSKNETTPGAPLALTQMADKMSTLENAKREGVISDTRYYVQLNDLVTRAKNQYPGHVAFIDQKIKEITGVDPANAIRISMQNDINNLIKKRTDGLDAQQKYIMQNEEWIADVPRWWEKPFEEQRQIIATRKAAHQQNIAEAADIANKERNGLDTQSLTEKFALNNLTQIYNGALNTFIEQLGGQQALDRLLQSGTKLSAEQIEALTAAINQIETAADLKANTFLNSSVSASDKSLTPRFILARGGKAERVADVLKGAKAQLEVIKQALVTGDMATIKSQASFIKNTQDKAMADLYRSSDIPAKEEAIRKSLGNETYSWLVSRPESGRLSAILEMFRIMNLHGSTVGGEAGVEYFSDQVKRQQTAAGLNPQQKAEVNSPTAWRTMLDQKIGIIVNPQAPPTAKLNNVLSLFADPNGSYFLSKFQASDVMPAFTRIVSPDVSAAVKQLGPAAQEAYRNWVKTNFELVFQKTGSIIKEDLGGNPYAMFSFDSKNLRFNIDPTPTGLKAAGGSRANWERLMTGTFTTTSLDAVKKLNAGLEAIKPALEDEAVPYAMQVMQNFGLEDTSKSSGFRNTINSIIEKTLERMDQDRQRGQGKSSSSDSTGGTISLTDTDDPLKRVIRKAEASGSYNKMYGVKGDINIEGMTVNDVLALQESRLKRGAESTAVGGYQFLNKTLKSLKKDLGLTGEELMSKELQDKMADHLLNRRGLADFKAGKLSREDFINNLAKEWAGLPTTTGRSYYHGDKVGNRATITLPEVLEAIDGIGLERAEDTSQPMIIASP